MPRILKHYMPSLEANFALGERRKRRSLRRRLLSRNPMYTPPIRKKIVRIDLLIMIFIADASFAGLMNAPWWCSLLVYQKSVAVWNARSMNFHSTAVDYPSFARKMSSEPPLWPDYLMSLFLGKEDRVAIPGDLREEFVSTIIPRFGEQKALLWYWKQAISTVA